MKNAFTNSGERVELTSQFRNLGHGDQEKVIYSDGSEGWEHVEDLQKEIFYNLLKNYEEKPSKSHVEKKGISLEKAQFELDVNERLWNKNGGLVIERTDMSLTVQESDESETITWIIKEV